MRRLPMPMKISDDRKAVQILLLLLVGVMSSASIVPFMGVYIVEGLGKEPWLISIYTGITISLTLIVNRQFGEWIDKGARISLLIVVSIVAFIVANLAIITVQKFWVLVTVASLCFSIANAATSTMYSYGRLYAERAGLDTTRYNSYLRTMTSLGWMLAPALSFFVASRLGPIAVFQLALALAAIWLLLWHTTVPKNFVSPATRTASNDAATGSGSTAKSLWFAAFICLCFSLAHTLCMSALPLFYLKEAGLPTYAPGLSFSVKTLIEIFCILGSPWLIKRFGARESLIGSAMIAVLSFYVLSQVTSIEQMIFGATLEGLYYGIFAGVGITYIQSFADGKMARATSLYMNSLFLGGLISGSAMGFIAQISDFRTVIQLASLWIFAALIALIFKNPKTAH